MRSIESRIEALERPERQGKPLPTLLPETAPQAEIEALRRRGVDALRDGDPETIERFSP